MAKPYVPDAGEIVRINFTPQAGHEQAGRRPALSRFEPGGIQWKDRSDDLLSADHASQELSLRGIHRRHAAECGAGRSGKRVLIGEAGMPKPKGRVSPEQLAEVRAKGQADIGSRLPA